ncbi:MAG: hypothetical protein HUJ77_02285 [Clostridium sp.]|uniref:hypothetical protein n=1 Tax=Clostridium sp. TaxID=1506 RepID=UPI0025C14811|nr:hypothetical protein [Clostridium sp.]MCF0147207.1 hypothetical protein [Clostridium sp.]
MNKKLLKLLSGFLVYAFIITNFIYFLSSTKKFTSNYEDNTTSNVSNFITDSNRNIETSIINFMQNIFNIRNTAFLNGNVEKLYKFYDTSDNFGEYSLTHEFKRIAFLRNLARNKKLTFKNIESTPTIKELKVKNGLYNLTLNESYTFTYFNNDNPDKVKTFSVDLIHTLELKDSGNSFIISKDYYEDYFKNGLDEYEFNLTEKIIP